MKHWAQVGGVAIGLLTAAGVLSLKNGGTARPPGAGPILSECGGRLRELVIHYEPSAREVSLPVYREFLAALESGVRVDVVTPDAAAYAEFAAAVGRVRCALRPVAVGHAITTWSRDRWVPLSPERPGGAAVLLSPRGEAADEIWPARAGDERVGADLAAFSEGRVRARRSALYFDGGDFLADERNVFVMPRMIARNLQQTAATRELVLQQLGAELGKRVILLTNAPDHHAGMFMCAAGGRRMLVGDPGLGRALLPAAGAGFDADSSSETQARLDAVAAQCAAEGYRVTRIATVVGRDGRTYLTYVNALIDRPQGRAVVYLPSYRGFENLNRAARETWASLGYEVRPVDCTSVYRHFGCLHCLVNVVSREASCSPS